MCVECLYCLDQYCLDLYCLDLYCLDTYFMYCLYRLDRYCLYCRYTEAVKIARQFAASSFRPAPTLDDAWHDVVRRRRRR